MCETSILNCMQRGIIPLTSLARHFLHLQLTCKYPSSLTQMVLLCSQCVIIAYAMLGMEALSLEIEDPFGREFNDLPMDSMLRSTLQVSCMDTRPPVWLSVGKKHQFLKP